MYTPPTSDIKSKLNRHFLDIAPLLGRLVIFRSDLIEHEVLPTASERVAITVWASGYDPTHSPVLPLCPFIYPSLPLTVVPSSSSPRATTARESRSNSLDSIFVSIAAYRDSECIPTLLDLFEKADMKENLLVGVVWQGYDNEFDIESNKALAPFLSQIKVLRLHPRDATGPCFARHLAQTLWSGHQPYFLQIDSHMRFRVGWDTYFIRLLRHCKTELRTEKPILTTYPVGYELPDRLPSHTRSTCLHPSHFDENGILRQRASFIKAVSHNL